MRTTREKLPEHQEFLLFWHDRAPIEHPIRVPLRKSFDQLFDGFGELERILIPMLDEIMLMHVLNELVKRLIKSIDIKAETRTRSQVDECAT